MKQSYELLAPAGNMDCLYAAFSAGADAVYLAGQSFGARAYAGNFSEEELIEALDYAHLHHKRIYLTLNTLIKEKEFSKILPYLQPFYENGLDAVIIQDLGLIPFLKDYFPNLELHASTQMTVNSYRSAKWLKEQGICRVVPSRELSLKELLEIKEKASIEVEAFIHGALCYSYSGQCLFSSFLGGRSGNRGRCAGPCRLPYIAESISLKKDNHIKNDKKKKIKNEEFPLSLKDLCSLPNIYDLMDAGIDSFKIEGRMKSPEYVAGVTAIYRKYMDAYLRFDGDRKKLPAVSKEDMDNLQKLYIRSNVQDGYLKKHNGRDMISLDSPSYRGSDDHYVSWVHSTYCENKLKQPVYAYLTLKKGERASLELIFGDVVYRTTGDVIQSALNHPLEEKDVRKQMNKTGNSDFYFENLEIDMDSNIFMPLKSLNELRRNALDELKKKLLTPFKQNKVMNAERYTDDLKDPLAKNKNFLKNNHYNKANPQLHIRVQTKEQLNYLLTEFLNTYNKDEDYSVKRIYVPADFLYLNYFSLDDLVKKAILLKIELIFALPHIFRMRSNDYANFIAKKMNKIDGFLVSNLEELQWLEESDYQGKIILDSTVYQWNRSAMNFLKNKCSEFTYPLELSKSEIIDLNNLNGIYVLYGRVPMMVSANCIKNTMDGCSHSENAFSFQLTDRYKKSLSVFINCVHCYNEVYNAVATSLHKEAAKMIENGFRNFRLDFTNEDIKTMKAVLEYYSLLLENPDMNQPFPLKEYTTGHLKEGAL